VDEERGTVHYRRVRGALGGLLLLPLLMSCASRIPPPHPLPISAVPSLADTPAHQPPTALSATLPLRANRPQRYRVQRGDTLWDIANRFLHDPWFWPELWQDNPDIANPHLIYPGDELQLVWQKGRYRLARQPQRPSIRLSPSMRERLPEPPIPALSAQALVALPELPLLLSAATLAAAPDVVATGDHHLLAAAGHPLYVRALQAPHNSRYRVVREGRHFVDPITGEALGIETIPVAAARLQEAGKPARIALEQSWREARVGDRILSADTPALLPPLSLTRPATPIDAPILALFDGVAQVGQYQLLVVGAGERDGLAAGALLTVWQQGAVVIDPQQGTPLRLPPLRAGVVVLLRTFERLSYGVVMAASRPIRQGDRVAAR